MAHFDRIFVFLLGVLNSKNALGQSRCPSGFAEHGETCYKASNTEATWAGAMGYCDTMDGHLAIIEDQDQQDFLQNYINILYNETTIALPTKDDYVYHYLHDMGLDIRGHTSFTFYVEACHDVHIALSQDKGVDTSNTYEIVIGGWSDSLSVIRDCKQCAHMDTQYHSVHPVSCTEYKPFWISWSDNIIRVGKGVLVGKEQFLRWNDTSPHEVNYLAVATGFGSNGAWNITVGNYRPGQFWIGASDLALEGEWIWLPTLESMRYHNWDTKQPDNDRNREHCALIDIHRGYKWADDNCEEHKNFICQVDR